MCPAKPRNGSSANQGTGDQLAVLVEARRYELLSDQSQTETCTSMHFIRLNPRVHENRVGDVDGPCADHAAEHLLESGTDGRSAHDDAHAVGDRALLILEPAPSRAFPSAGISHVRLGQTAPAGISDLVLVRNIVRQGL